jgi:hypothetical protein
VGCRAGGAGRLVVTVAALGCRWCVGVVASRGAVGALGAQPGGQRRGVVVEFVADDGVELAERVRPSVDGVVDGGAGRNSTLERANLSRASYPVSA